MDPKGLVAWQLICKLNDEYLWCDTGSFYSCDFQGLGEHCAARSTRPEECRLFCSKLRWTSLSLSSLITAHSRDGKDTHLKHEYATLFLERRRSITADGCQSPLRVTTWMDDVQECTIMCLSLQFCRSFSLEGFLHTRPASSILWNNFIDLIRLACRGDTADLSHSRGMR